MRQSLKLKKCKVCKAEFLPWSTLQRCCGKVQCALDLVRAEAEADKKRWAREERRKLREAKAKLKTRSQWMREAQAAFNAYVRARDEGLPCISCGIFGPRKYDAGHYRSVGSNPALRFDEDNCHLQCVPCNQHKSGNAIDYRIGLLARIGEERVARLEGPHEPKKYTIDDLKAIKAEYTRKRKELAQNPVYPVV